MQHAGMNNGSGGFDGFDGLVAAMASMDGFDGFDGSEGFHAFEGFNAFDGFDGFEGFDAFDAFDGFDGLDGFEGLEGVASKAWTASMAPMTPMLSMLRGFLVLYAFSHVIAKVSYGTAFSHIDGRASLLTLYFRTLISEISFDDVFSTCISHEIQVGEGVSIKSLGSLRGGAPHEYAGEGVSWCVWGRGQQPSAHQ